MFVRLDTVRFPWPVTVLSPSLTVPGTMDAQTYTAVFLQLPGDEWEGFLADGNQTQKGILTKVLVGWSEITAEDKVTAIPFTAEVRDALLQDVHFRVSTWKAYADAMTGRAPKERAEGN